ncbi:hypothetical protein PIB30_073226 [Stylosanthes scabra]|uniref:Uncharacterized protein n=1 Tax=Stylosanthes scabra TaxID=79078 RepID=A0ABU6YRZ2_9FABA|nr:hypothetical protein [Stylosanthes scabra]
MSSVPYFMEIPWNSQELVQYPRNGECSYTIAIHTLILVCIRRGERELRVAGDGAAIGAPSVTLFLAHRSIATAASLYSTFIEPSSSLLPYLGSLQCMVLQTLLFLFKMHWSLPRLYQTTSYIS